MREKNTAFFCRRSIKWGYRIDDFSEEEKETDAEESEPSGANPPEVEAVADMPLENTSSGNRNRVTFLVDIYKDENMNKDAYFLDAIHELWD